MAKQFHNVKVRIETGFGYEEISKVWIIGQLAQQLSHDLGYTESLFLDFSHHYIGSLGTLPDYFISFDQGGIHYNNRGNTNPDNTKPTPVLKQNALVIRQVSKRFNIVATLNLIEYAIKNMKYVKASQRRIHYKKDFRDWLINSIDTVAIKNLANSPASENVQKVLSNRIMRPEKKARRKSLGLSYYVQNGSYVVYASHQEYPQNALLQLTDIYQFKKITDDLLPKIRQG